MGGEEEEALRLEVERESSSLLVDMHVGGE